MVGLDGAGKTTVLYKLKASDRRVQTKESRWWRACWAVGAGCLCVECAWERSGMHGMHSVCMGIITLKPELLRYAVQLGENISTVPTIGALRLLCRLLVAPCRLGSC